MKAPARRHTARIALTLGTAALGVSLLGVPALADDAVSTSDTTVSDTTAADTTVADGTAVVTTPTTTTGATATTATTTTTATTATTVVATAPTAAQIRQAKAGKVIALAKKYSGRPYRWGAAGPKAFDCSGYTKYIYKKLGIKLPHHAAKQAKKGKRISRANARPGDLVFFKDSSGRIFHVGIYAGGNKMYDAPTAGKKTGKHRIWSKRVEFRRYF
ncbi:MAG: peptidase P60 [Hamadaea sp.]|nr:peptidase P60 [Hamadaea sp.]